MLALQHVVPDSQFDSNIGQISPDAEDEMHFCGEFSSQMPPDDDESGDDSSSDDNDEGDESDGTHLNTGDVGDLLHVTVTTPEILCSSGGNSDDGSGDDSD